MTPNTTPPPGGSFTARQSRVVFAPGSPNVQVLDAGLSELEAIEHKFRALEAERLTVLASLHNVAVAEAAVVGERGQIEGTMAYRSMQAEIAAALHAGAVTAGRQLKHAHRVVGSYPKVLDALAAGEISAAHTRVITDAGRVIGEEYTDDTPADAERRAQFETLVVAKAATTSPAGLGPYAKRVAERYATVSLDERYERAKAHRMVTVAPLEDGMARLSAILPAHHAIAAAARVRALAKQLQAVEEHTYREAKTHARAQGIEPPADVRRDRSQVLADVVAELLLNGGESADPVVGGTGGPVVRGIVQVITQPEHLTGDTTSEHDPAAATTTTPATAATAATGKPAATPSTTTDGVPAPELTTYGPIPVSVVREIAGNTPTWIEVTTDTSGCVAKIEPRFPSVAQRRHLIARDDTCRWFGCTMPAHHCDIDHTVAYSEGGTTTIANLGHLCRNHHLLKHHGGWNIEQDDRGDYAFVSPTGRSYRSRPASRVRFTPVTDPGNSPNAMDNDGLGINRAGDDFCRDDDTGLGGERAPDTDPKGTTPPAPDTRQQQTGGAQPF